MHEDEYDMKSYAHWGGYPPKPKAWAQCITPSKICISPYHTKAKFNNWINCSFKIFTRQNKTVTENNLVNDIKVTVHHLLVPKLRFLFVLQSVNLFAMSMVESLFLLSLYMFKTVRLLNRSWFILKWRHVFNPRAVEKDLSLAALVAGFTRISLHNVITSFIISHSGLGSSLIFTVMSSKQK